MKGNGAIAALFRKQEAKLKNVVAEEQPEEQDEVQLSEIDSETEIEDGNDAEYEIQSSTAGTQAGSSARAQARPYDIHLLPGDPGKRIAISRYEFNDQDFVRRGYITKGPCRPYAHDFPTRNIYGRPRHFSFIWFEKYNWLEYSISKDAGYCFVCYLFKEKTNGGHRVDTFVNKGWRNWNKCDALLKHVGGVSSVHNQAQEKYNLFVTPHTSIDRVIVKVSKEDLRLYMERLTYSVRCLRFLLHQGLACHGHDESEENKW